MSARERRETGRPAGFDELLAELKAKRYRPVYVLEGEDAHRMEGVVLHLRDAVLDAAAQAFNYHVYAGEDADLRAVLRQALSYPLLAERQLLWLRDADRCSLAEEREAALAKYLAAPVPATVLVLTATKLDGRRRWVKAAREAGGHFVFANPEGAALAEWARRAAAKAGLALDAGLAELLCERVGGDLRALSGEITKLALAAEEAGGALTPADVRALVRQHREADVFDLVNALAPGDPVPALRAWRRLADDGHAAQELIPLLIWRVRMLAMADAMSAEGRPDAEIQRATNLWGGRLAQARAVARGLGEGGLARALAACRRCESALKGSPLRPELVLERAILEICGPGA